MEMSICSSVSYDDFSVYLPCKFKIYMLWKKKDFCVVRYDLDLQSSFKVTEHSLTIDTLSKIGLKKDMYAWTRILHIILPRPYPLTYKNGSRSLHNIYPKAVCGWSIIQNGPKGEKICPWQVILDKQKDWPL